VTITGPRLLRSFRLRTLLSAALIMAGGQSALPAQCPPNSRPEIVAIPGNLRTAHCWCNRGYVNAGGVCVLAAPAPLSRQSNGAAAAPESGSGPPR
jgi:hypothetical protein